MARDVGSPANEKAAPRGSWRLLFLPAAILANRLALSRFAKERAHLLEPGEKMLAMETELGERKRLWVASDRALYIEEASKSGEGGYFDTRRIPYERIAGASDRREATVRTREIEVKGTDGTEREVIAGRFAMRRHGNMSQTITRQIGFRAP